VGVDGLAVQLSQVAESKQRPRHCGPARASGFATARWRYDRKKSHSACSPRTPARTARAGSMAADVRCVGGRADGTAGPAGVDAMR